MHTSELSNLESSLAANGKHEDCKLDAAQVVLGAFKLAADGGPAKADVQNFFKSKKFSAVDVHLNATGYSKHQCDLAFVALTQHGLHLKSAGDQGKAADCLDKANQISGSLEDFYSKQHAFMKGLSGSALEDKLCIEMCYESINKNFMDNHDAAYKLIGNGLKLAEKISDQKRKADFLAKAQFALYQLMKPKYPNVALSLGHYLCSPELESELKAEYRALKAWTHFRAGNIYIDFGGQKKEEKDWDGAMDDYARAKSEYDQTMAWAQADQVWYAVMLLHERLGVAYTRLELYDQALQSYDDSFTIAETKEHSINAIEASLIDKNTIRCYIGLGNVALESASGDKPLQNYVDAGTYFLDAWKLANEINYSANKDTAIFCLKKLMKELPR